MVFLLYSSNTTLVKVKFNLSIFSKSPSSVQIQHLLKLNLVCYGRVVKEYFSSNTTLVKVKFPFLQSVLRIQQVQIQHLLKLNVITISPALKPDFVQIQHLLKLNRTVFRKWEYCNYVQIQHLLKLNRNITSANSVSYSSNTTLVKVKFYCFIGFATCSVSVQIQHLLKLNAQKINLYDFHYTIKSIDIQGF